MREISILLTFFLCSTVCAQEYGFLPDKVFGYEVEEVEVKAKLKPPAKKTDLPVPDSETVIQFESPEVLEEPKPVAPRTFTTSFGDVLPYPKAGKQWVRAPRSGQYWEVNVLPRGYQYFETSRGISSAPPGCHIIETSSGQPWVVSNGWTWYEGADGVPFGVRDVVFGSAPVCPETHSAPTYSTSRCGPWGCTW